MISVKCCKMLTLFVFNIEFVNGTQGEVATMNADNNQQDVLKTPELPYPLSLTPPPSYEEATRNDHYSQPQPWLPSTSTGYTSDIPISNMSPPVPVFNVQYQCNAVAAATAAVAAAMPTTSIAGPPNVSAHNQTANNTKDSTAPPPKTTTIKNIPSVTITLDTDRNDQRSIEI